MNGDAPDIRSQADGFSGFLDSLPVVGRPHRETDLRRLRELIAQYPDEARFILAELTGQDATPEAPA